MKPKPAKVVPFRPRLYGKVVKKLTTKERLLTAELQHVMKRARDALYKYGDHKVGCAAAESQEEDCTCELYAVINSFYKWD